MTGDPIALTRLLAAHAVESDLSAVPAAALDLARRTLVDTVGVAVAARHDPAVALVRELVGPGQGSSQVLTDGSSAPAGAAAFVNGVAAHALDYDDVVDALYGHPSTVLWPALLAAGQAAGSTTRELLAAYLVAFDVEMALTRAFDIRVHYGHGWHATATFGVVAAAAGCARLLDCSVGQAGAALAVAASMAGGSRQNFGTMTKPLHAGLAARDGVLAAQLAARGFTADAGQLEGPLGFVALYGGDTARLGRVEEALSAPAGTAILRDGINVKKYPACYNTQRTLDAALEAAGSGVREADVESITLTIEPGGFDPLIHHRPTTGLEGKFSGEYAVAAALLDGRIGLDTYTDRRVNRPDARALVERVELVEAARPPVGPAAWDQAYAVVDVALAGGDHVVVRSDVPHGDTRSPLSDADLCAKFVDCLRFAGRADAADALHDQLTGFGDDTVFTGLRALNEVVGAARK